VSRHGIPALALGDCSKAGRASSDVERVDGVEDAFAAFCGEHQGLDANGFVSFCKHCCLIDRTFTTQDARLVYAEAVPVNLQRMELRNFEVALAHVAAQKGLDRGHIRQMVVSPDSAPSGHSRPQAMAPADRAAGEQLLPLMPMAPTEFQDIRRPVPRSRREFVGTPPATRTVTRRSGASRLTRSETMPASLDKAGTAAPVRTVTLEAVAVAPASSAHTDAEGPLPAAAEPPPTLEAEPPAPAAPPAGEGTSDVEAAAGGVKVLERVASGSDTPSQDLPDEAEEASMNSWSTLPSHNLPSDQACHLMPLVCAR